MEKENIVYLNCELRDELEIIEKNSKNRDIVSCFKHDQKAFNYISLIFGDAYILLNYKNKTSMITPQERKVLNIYEQTINLKENIYLIIQNQPDIFNIISKHASDFRKYNKLGKVRTFYFLDDTNKNVLNSIDYQLQTDLITHNISINDLEDHINPNEAKPTNLEYEFKSYFDFIMVNDTEKYKELKNYLMTYMNDLNFDRYKDLIFECKAKGITIEFIREYINAVITKKQEETKVK